MNTRTRRLQVSGRGLVALALLLVALLPLAATAAPPGDLTVSAGRGSPDALAGPCAPGVSYDPACDVDHDGDVDIFDVQLAAGHWNQSGVWTSDNSHDHLGQIWTGENNPLIMQGTFGNPDGAPLVLSNSTSTGHGLRVLSAGNTGVYVNTAGNNGLYVGTAGGDGVHINFSGSDGLSVGSAGQHGVNVDQALGNGVNVGVVEGYGVRVDQGRDGGFFVCRAGNVSDCTPSTTFHGLEVGNAQGDGVRVTEAAGDGVQIGDGVNFPATGLRIPSPGTPGDALLPNTSDSNGQWALWTTDNIQAGNVFLNAQTLVAVVSGDGALAPGDVVSAAGLADAISGASDRLVQVRLAGDSEANVVGVANSRMVLAPLEGDDGGHDMRSAAGPAQPGEFVAITVLGPAQVKLGAGETIQPGQRVTAGGNGAVRALQTRLVDGMLVSEGAPVIGVVLDAPEDGVVWVLVNPQ